MPNTTNLVLFGAFKRLSTKGVYLSQLPVLSNLKKFFQKMSEIRYKVDVWVKEPTFISEIFQKN